jgi:hypothetical protein
MATLSADLKFQLLSAIGTPGLTNELINAIQAGQNALPSLNGLTGPLSITAGSNVTISASGSTIQISSSGSGGVSSLNTLTGALSIVAGSGITVTPSGSNITIAASGSVVSSFNALTGAVVLAAGSNITLTPSGNTITIASSGGGSGANAALSNLASVAINTALLPGVTNTIALGSSSLYFSNIFLTASNTVQEGVTFTTDGSGGMHANSSYMRVGNANGQGTFLYDDGTNNELRFADGPTSISPNGHGGFLVAKGDFGGGGITFSVDTNGNINAYGSLLMGYAAINPPSTASNLTPLTAAANTTTTFWTYFLNADTTKNVNSIDVTVQGGNASTGDYWFFHRQFVFVNAAGTNYVSLNTAGVAIVPDILSAGFAGSSLVASVTGSFGGSNLALNVSIVNGSATLTGDVTAQVIFLNGHLN